MPRIFRRGSNSSASYITTAAESSLFNETVLGTGVIMAGLFSARPAASLAGRLYYATDLNIMSRDDGAAWSEVAAPVMTNLHTVHMSNIGAAPNQVVTGSGAWSVTAGNRGNQGTTGVTNPSSCSTRMSFATVGAVVSHIGRVRRFEVDFVLSDVYANSRSYLYLTDEGSDLAPVATFRHIGIKNLLGVVTFTTADGTTEQTTDISAFVAAATEVVAVMTYDGVTARCYINGTLRASHSTNVPAGGANMIAFRGFIDNNASANSRQLVVYSVDITVAAS